MYVALRRGLGAWRFREGTPDAIQAAMNWDPANPRYADAMATLRHLYGNGGDSNDVIELYKQATRLDPHSAQYWADLGSAYDWAGRADEALAAFQQARRLFPNSPEINWRLANFDVRTGKTSDGLKAMQIALRGNAAGRQNVFTLATRATSDMNAIVEILPAEAPVLFEYLDFQIERGNRLAAQETWARILESQLHFDLSESFPYLDALIQHKELVTLQDAWKILAQRFPDQIGREILDSNLVTNGNFDSEILNGGLDWRVIPTEGVVVSVDSTAALEGGRALKIAFDGSRNISYGQVFQYVPVQPNTHYRFVGRIRVQGITTDSGPRFRICDAYNQNRALASTKNIIGTSGWAEQRVEFTTGRDTQLLIISVARPRSEKLDNQIAGDVWISGVNLAPSH